MSYTNPFKVPLPRIHNMLAQNHYGWLREKYLSKAIVLIYKSKFETMS